jgi:hypothetical protein
MAALSGRTGAAVRGAVVQVHGHVSVSRCVSGVRSRHGRRDGGTFGAVDGWGSVQRSGFAKDKMRLCRWVLDWVSRPLYVEVEGLLEPHTLLGTRCYPAKRKIPVIYARYREGTDTGNQGEGLRATE